MAKQSEAMDSDMTANKLLSTKKGTRKPKKMKPVPVTAYENPQLSLFQSVLANTDDDRDELSNLIDLWDSIPRYSISRQKMQEMRVEGGYLPIREAKFQHRGKEYLIEIRPARIQTVWVKTKKSEQFILHEIGPKRIREKTKKTIEYYPSAREELVEHALRKLAVEQNAGFFDRNDYRSGVAFTLHQLREELAEQGHSMSYPELCESLEILHYSFIDVIDLDSDLDDPSLISQPYLPGLAKVNKTGRASDPNAKWFVQFHGLVTDSINQINYRQFNYQRLMQCKTQLARWLITQLVLKYTAASVTNSFDMQYSTIKRDSGLLDGYKRERAAIAALDDAWEEIKNLRDKEEEEKKEGEPPLLYRVEKIEQPSKQGKLEDVFYTLYPARKFAKEQKAANRRKSDARQTLRLPVDKPVDKSVGK